VGLVTQRYAVSLAPELESLLRQSHSTSESILSKWDYQKDAPDLNSGEAVCWENSWLHVHSSYSLFVIYLFIYIYIYIYMHVYIYIYIIYMHVYICIYIYIYSCIFKAPIAGIS